MLYEEWVLRSSLSIYNGIPFSHSDNAFIFNQSLQSILEWLWSDSESCIMSFHQINQVNEGYVKGSEQQCTGSGTDVFTTTKESSFVLLVTKVVRPARLVDVFSSIVVICY